MGSSPDIAAEESRRRVIRIFLIQGTIGFLLMAWLTWLRHDQTAHVIRQLGPSAFILIATFVAFGTMLALLKFELTDLIFVSLVITAYMTMYPLLGAVISSWLAVLVSVLTRWLAMKQIGPVKIDMRDPVAEYAKMFGLFGTYGIPVLAAASLYSVMGGELPITRVNGAAAFRIAVCDIAMVLTNNLLMFRPARAYGYTVRRVIQLDVIDSSIYFLTLPFAVVMSLSYPALGWGALLALAFSGVVANLVARNLALTRGKSQMQLQRLASLSNIGKMISLRFTTEELLATIYAECKKIVDCTLFSIALLDEHTNELSFELDIKENQVLPKTRIDVGEGLNSWVLRHHQPLLIASVDDERRYGVTSIADNKPTEAWLGVPMIARDRVIGVISVESFKKGAFDHDDLLLLTSIANQAAVALENAHLYKDLEGLTYALEQRVQERTNELRETNLRLMAADRSKNQFLANMSHELRTPLNSIIGFSSVLIENTRSVIQPRLYKFLENIHTAGNHLLELINDILDLSKIEAGKMELRPDEFDLHDTIAAVERVMKGFASDANVTISTSIDPDVPLVSLDEGRLKQILFNLLSNAVKFSPQGGPVQLSISWVAAPQSPIGVESIRIDVADQGIGIAPEEVQQIFEEFYQTEEGRRSRRGGTGLGLSLTRNFVELHHGTIEVRSSPGQGSVFTMYLPVKIDEAAHGLPRPLLHAAPRTDQTAMH